MRWRVVIVMIVVAASCKKGRERSDDEAARAMALGAIADIKQAIATAKTRLGTPDARQGLVRCASVAAIRLELRDTPFHDLATELDRLCDVELPTAELVAALALTAEDPARCQTLELGPQLELLGKSQLPETTQAIARFRETCPLAPVAHDGSGAAVPGRALGGHP